MKKSAFHSPCLSCPMNRRTFMARSALAAAGALTAWPAMASAPAAGPADKTRVRIIYALHAPKQDRPDWPNIGFNFQPHMEKMTRELEHACHGFTFLASVANGPEQAKALMAEDKAAGNIDGYVICQMNCWNRVAQTVAESGKPVLYTDFQFGGSGGFLVYNAAFLRSGVRNVGYVASSRKRDLVDAVQCMRGASAEDYGSRVCEVRLRGTPRPGRVAGRKDEVKCLDTGECLARLKQSRILAVRGQEAGPAGEMMGIQIQHVPFAELNEAWKAADRDQARAVADAWVKGARRVQQVSRETLDASAAMYLAQKALLRKHNAQGITVNCLGGFYGGHIHAYPCLGFHQLLNEGLVGGCECDVRSAATMLVGTTLTQGRPGYISDPVIDTSKRQIIYAHCVAANKAFGPQGRANAFDIMTHSEDRQGASVRSVLPTGYMTTTLEFDSNRKEVLFHRGLALENDPDDRACRTKLCAEPVGDIEKLFTMWDQWSWHRVTFYGDLREPVYALATALGYRVVEEA